MTYRGPHVASNVTAVHRGLTTPQAMDRSHKSTAVSQQASLTQAQSTALSLNSSPIELPTSSGEFQEMYEFTVQVADVEALFKMYSAGGCLCCSSRNLKGTHKLPDHATRMNMIP
eukprot:2668960-Amphidinium_carterae.1